MNKLINIDQCLHGYSGGHRLLSSSLNLDSADERLMLVLSDMSGQSITKGFESYITGYPLQKLEKYVFAKTWYAPEMIRPGCVWTHSIIINNNELKFLRNPSILSKYFKCPDISEKHFTYNQQLTITDLDLLFDNSDNSDYSNDWNDEFVDILFALYLNPNQQVFIPSALTNKYENLIFRIWEYQGPKLRSTFKFCTGAIENRSTAEFPFDIQVIPEKNFEKIRQKNRDSIFINKYYLQSIKYPLWKETFCRVINDSQESIKFKNYVFKYDYDLKNCRGGYLNLTHFYFDLQNDKMLNNDKYSALIFKLNNEFPDKTEANELKAHILFDFEDEQLNRLFTLCTIKNSNSFDPNLLNFEDRIISLLDSFSDNWTLSNLLLKIINAHPNQLGTFLISIISKNISIKKALLLSNQSNIVLDALIYHNPRLCLNPEFWKVDIETKQSRLFNVLSIQKLDKNIIKELIELFIEFNEDLLLSSVIKKYETFSITSILDYLIVKDKIIDFQCFPNSVFEITNRQDIIIKWVLKNKSKKNIISVLPFLFSVLDPYSKSIIDLGVNFWNSFCNQKFIINQFCKSVYIPLFFFSVALNFQDIEAEQIISETFLPVYNHAKNDHIPNALWQKTLQKLDFLPWYQNWDKCERLTKSLISRYLDYRLSPQYFFYATDQVDVFTRTLSISMENNSLRERLYRDLFINKENFYFISSLQWGIVNNNSSRLFPNKSL